MPPGEPPRIGRPLLCVLQNAPDGPQNMAFALLGSTSPTWSGQPLPISLAPFGAPGGQVFIEPLFSIRMGVLSRLASLLLPMPASTTAIGQQFTMQGVILEPGWNALSSVLSDAAIATIGTR